MKKNKQDIFKEINTEPSNRDMVLSLLDNIDKRERVVIFKRWFADDDRVITLQEIANEYNVDKERIRQIEARGFRKLRQLIKASV